jgi:hypothetical protein
VWLQNGTPFSQVDRCGKRHNVIGATTLDAQTKEPSRQFQICIANHQQPTKLQPAIKKPSTTKQRRKILAYTLISRVLTNGQRLNYRKNNRKLSKCLEARKNSNPNTKNREKQPETTNNKQQKRPKVNQVARPYKPHKRRMK